MFNIVQHWYSPNLYILYYHSMVMHLLKTMTILAILATTGLLTALVTMTKTALAQRRGNCCGTASQPDCTGGSGHLGGGAGGAELGDFTPGGGGFGNGDLHCGGGGGGTGAGRFSYQLSIDCKQDYYC